MHQAVWERLCHADAIVAQQVLELESGPAHWIGLNYHTEGDCDTVMMSLADRMKEHGVPMYGT